MEGENIVSEHYEKLASKVDMPIKSTISAVKYACYSELENICLKHTCFFQPSFIVTPTLPYLALFWLECGHVLPGAIWTFC